jgi:hypothetical protein
MRLLGRSSGRGSQAVLLAVLLLAAGGCAPARAPARSPSPNPAALRGATDLRTPITLATIRRWNPRPVDGGYGIVGRMAMGAGTMATGTATGAATGTAAAGTGGSVDIWGRADVPNVQILVSGDRVVGVRGLFAASDGPQPWFDQAAAGTPAGSATPSATASATAGGGGAWFTQTVWFEKPGQGGPYGLSSWDRLRQINPKLADARQITGFVPMMGVHWGHVAPGLVFMVDKQNRVVAVEGTFGAASGFQPFYDQLPGHQDIVLQTGARVYSEHIWFVDPAGIR